MALALQLFSYIVFILCIVQITKYKDVFGDGVSNYVSPVVAILVMSCLQMLFHVGYWLKRKSPLYSFRNMVLALALFLAWNFGAVVALTVKRHDYCGRPIVGTGPGSTAADCQGLIRAMMGMTWNLFGWGLLYVLYLVLLKSRTRSASNWPVGRAGIEERSPLQEKEESLGQTPGQAPAAAGPGRAAR